MEERAYPTRAPVGGRRFSRCLSLACVGSERYRPAASPVMAVAWAFVFIVLSIVFVMCRWLGVPIPLRPLDWLL